MSIIKDQPRLRLARMARHRANAESIRQKAEAMRDPQMRQHLLTLANQFESMAESIDCMPDSKPVRRDTTQRGPQLQRQSDDDFEVRRIKATSTTSEIANETRLFDLNIEKILEAWDNTHAVRELISNALDEQELTGTAEITVRKDGNQTWIIRDYGRGLRYDHFTQNESPEKLKNSGRVIGKFGVGLKDALATLHRNGVSVEIESAHCIITLAQRGKHGFGDVVTLHAVVAPARDKKFVGTVVRLKGLADREMNTAKGLFLRFSGDKVIEQTRVGRILEKKGRTARIYIAGLLVAEEENFAFSYDITSLTEPMKKALNRERSNVGRTAYAERVKSMLLQTRSEIVGKVLARQLVELEHGMGSDEVHWKDVAVHGCKILNASGRYLFVTTSQIMSNGNAIGHAKNDGFRIVTVPDNIHSEVAGALDLSGAPIRDLGVYQTEWNNSFKFTWVPVESMTAEERTIFARADLITALIGGLPKHVRAIRISETMRPDFVSGTDVIGLWDAESESIVIRRDQLKTLRDFAGTLLHELAHAYTGYHDVTREFENELTTLLGTAAAVAIDSVPNEPESKRSFWRR